MPSTWRHTDLPELAATLCARPGHENVRTLIAEVLRHGFGAAYAALDHEVRLPEVRGRADMLFGATVFEFKSDLRREMGDVLARLPDYLAERERLTRRHYLGLATDGATFVAFDLRDGSLVEIGRHELRPDAGDVSKWTLTPQSPPTTAAFFVERPSRIIVMAGLARPSTILHHAAAIWPRS